METTDFRLRRLLRRASGRSLVVAFDRGVGGDATGGGEDPVAIANAAIDGGADGLLVSPGVARVVRPHLAFRGAPSLLVRCDLMVYGALQPAGTAGVEAEEYRVLLSPREAAELGADAVVMFLILGNPDDSITADNMQAVARAAAEARQVGIPLIVETVLWGARVDDQADLDALVYVNRLAAELGADAVKTQSPGTVEGMRRVVEHCPVPVLALGGPRTDSLDDLVADSAVVVDGGAIGLVYGRNIWQAADPAGTARALSEMLDTRAS
ncbi:MAG: hypothetical protein WA971_13415 [Microbacterium sp.]